MPVLVEGSIGLVQSLGRIIVFLMIFFSFFLFTVKSTNKLSNRIFAVFLLITALDLTGLFLGSESLSSVFLNLKTASSLLQMPIFYLYVLSVCYSDFKIKPRHLVHGILFCLFVVLFKATSFSHQSLLYYRIVGEIQYIGYIIAVFLVLKKYKRVYLENYSNPSYTSYRWLFQITLLFCVAHVFVLMKMVFSFMEDYQYLLQNIYILISVFALFIICWFVLKAMYSPHLFTGVKTGLVPLKSTMGDHKLKIEDNSEIKGSVQTLTSYMESEKPYLDFELTLQKLAQQLDMPERELSMLINHHLGKHFFDFINEYRIGEAKKILEDPGNKELTVLEVLYQVGFNSKSSFYTAFKKITSQTPTEFRKSALSD